jgi:hypothetical protein
MNSDTRAFSVDALIDELRANTQRRGTDLVASLKQRHQPISIRQALISQTSRGGDYVTETSVKSR